MLNRLKKTVPSVFKLWVRKLDDRFFGGVLVGYLGRKKAVGGKPAYTPEEEHRILGNIVDEVKKPLPTDRELKRVEIMVLKYKDPEVEVRCVTDIIKNTIWPYKINVYDNRYGTKNMGKIFNTLIRQSTCDYFLMIDSDAFVPNLDPCWLTRMMNTFDKKDDCYVVVPRVNRTSCVQQRADKAEDCPPEKLTVPLAGMCALYKKEIFEKIGYFDEDFLLYGCDTEWGERLLRSPYAAYVRHDILVEHLKHYSTKKASLSGEYNSWIEGEYASGILRKKLAK